MKSEVQSPPSEVSPLEEELKKRVQELTALDRRKDEFLTIFAHELRNPLAAINSAVRILSRPDGEQHADWVKSVLSRQVEHLSQMTETLLDVSRITRGTLKLVTAVFPLSVPVMQAVKVLENTIKERKHSFTIDGLSDSVRVVGDAARLEKVFVALLSNAAKYTPDGGAIVLAVEVTDANVLVRVTDNGTGITPENIPTIFDFFAPEYSLEKSAGGLGVGLTVAKKFVELHGGAISVASAGTGKGSMFTVSLPLA